MRPTAPRLILSLSLSLSQSLYLSPYTLMYIALLAHLVDKAVALAADRGAADQRGAREEAQRLVLQKSTPPQIRQLILYISNSKE